MVTKGLKSEKLRKLYHAIVDFPLKQIQETSLNNSSNNYSKKPRDNFHDFFLFSLYLIYNAMYPLITKDSDDLHVSMSDLKI